MAGEPCDCCGRPTDRTSDGTTEATSDGHSETASEGTAGRPTDDWSECAVDGSERDGGEGDGDEDDASVGHATDGWASGSWWLDERPVTDAPLPSDVTAAMGDVLNATSINTLGDVAAAVREVVGGDAEGDAGGGAGRDGGRDAGGVAAGEDAADATAAESGALDAADLCHTAAETPHRATMGDETYRFRCFFDGVVLAHLADERVAVRTESPAGDPIGLEASPDGTLGVTPADAVMSFGVAATAAADGPDAGVGSDDAVDGAPSVDGATPEELAICPYVRAFPARDDYERWAEGVDAPTVGLPLAAGVAFAAALAG